MEMLWFCAISLMLTLYVVLDGFDLGIGVLYLFAARSQRDRRSALAALGPFWDGNEMWLLAATVVLYLAFPAGVRLGFSGYSLTLTLALWLLLTRGLAGEALSRMPDDSNRTRALHTVFGVTSLALPVLFGLTLGNLIRGIPLTHTMRFFDWFALVWVGAVLSVVSLTGALWLAYCTEGELQSRCRRIASHVWWAVLLSCGGAMVSSLFVQPHFVESLRDNSWMAVLGVTTLAGLLGARLCQSVGFDLGAFSSALVLIAGLIGTVAAGQFPYLLGPGIPGGPGLAIYNASNGTFHPSVALLCSLPAILLAFGYNLFARRRFPKVETERARRSQDLHARPHPLMTAGD